MNKRDYRKQVPTIAASRWIDGLDITPTEDHVLRVFCDFIGDDYTAFPSQVILAKRCKFKDRETAGKALKGLREKGLIEDTGKRRGRAVVYHVPVPEEYRLKKKYQSESDNSAGFTGTTADSNSAGSTESNAGFTGVNSAGSTGPNSAGFTSTNLHNLQEPTKEPSENVSEEIPPEKKKKKKGPPDSVCHGPSGTASVCAVVQVRANGKDTATIGMNDIQLQKHKADKEKQLALNDQNAEAPLSDGEQAQLDALSKKFGL
ncbi:MAG: hypothetical protein CME59_09680 [Halioglobus sp.]|mgnify:CR=1 FL=1|nr:hypothetical protein [Halioglobus sp.]|tara:strand:- start:2452 stop:3231 length:780 start_codon:yes stop_codon:yes gene_type:complete